MIRLNWKFLAFYSISIIAVVTLFRVVTAYAKANLKAPPPIDGSYLIDTQNLPDCLKSEPLVLNILQSGIYLNGSLLSGDTNKKHTTSSEKKSSLSGKLSNKQISLVGTVPWVSRCNQSAGAGNQNWVQINGVIQRQTLTGKISLNSIPGVEFMATKEKPKEEENEH